MGYKSKWIIWGLSSIISINLCCRQYCLVGNLLLIHMRKFIIIPVVFILGWMLAWSYFQWSMQPAATQVSKAPVAAVKQTPTVQSSPTANRQLPASEAVVASEAQITKEQLVNNQFEAAVSRYSTMQAQLTEDELAEHRKLILSRARALINAGKMIEARRLPSLFLENEIYIFNEFYTHLLFFKGKDVVADLLEEALSIDDL